MGGEPADDGARSNPDSLTGDHVLLEGFAMFMSFVVFSLLAIYNQKETDEAVNEFDRWFDRTFGNER